MKYLLFVVLVGLGACTGSSEGVTAAGETAADETRDVNALLADAVAADQRAAESLHAWTKTSRLIEKSRRLLAEGQDEAALETARRALFIAEASVAQAEREKTAWQARVPK